MQFLYFQGLFFQELESSSKTLIRNILYYKTSQFFYQQ